MRKRRFLAAVAAAAVLMFSMSMTAFAVVSPTGTATTQESSGKSPKTGDENILYVELAGAALAVAAIAARKRSAQEAEA